MRTRLIATWDNLRSSYWFVPALMTISGAILAWSMSRLDHGLGHRARFDLFAGTPEGARSMLSTLAGAQITLAGLSFSITIVALTVASQQFGPRLLRNFMRDLGNQVVLGTFVASFVYCVIVLGQIRGGEDSLWVPALSLVVAVALALASLGVLIYFIHHVSSSIQASTLIAVVGTDIDSAVHTLFPEEIGNETEEHDDLDTATPDGGGTKVLACAVGYVQAIDLDGLMTLACERDLQIRLHCRPGDRVVPEVAVATVWQDSDDEVAQAVDGALIVGTHRTPVQDLEFSIDQLVEIAVRALSPGINDPFTAMTCIDRLTASLCRLARRRIPSPVRRDEDGRVRVVARPWTFRGAIDEAFDQIRQHARGNAAVSIRLLEGLGLLASRVWRPDDRDAVRRQVEMVGRSAAAIVEPFDRDQLLLRVQRAQAVLDAAPASIRDVPTVSPGGRALRSSG